MRDKAGQLRNRAKASVHKIVNVRVDLNELLSQLNVAGLVVAHKCTSCGANLKISGNSEVMGITTCKHCNTEFDVVTVANIIKDALS